MQDGRRRAIIALDEAVVHEGDCLELLREVPDESIDLTIFSPPYDGIRDYEKGWTLDLAALGKELYRVTKPNRVCVMVMGDGTEKRARTLSTWRTAVNWVDEAGWRLFQDIVYARDGNPGPWWNTRFRVDHEYICVFFKGDDLEVFRKEHLAVPSKHAGRTFTGTDRLTDGTTRKIDGGVVADTKCRGTIWRYSTSNSEGNSLVFQSHGDVLEEAKDGSSGKAIIGDKSNDGLKALQSCSMSSASRQEFAVFFRMTRVWSTAEDGKDEYSDIPTLTDLYVSCAHNGLASADQRQTCNDNLEAVNRIRDQIKEKASK